MKEKTLGSPVQKFGDFDFISEPIANFEGGKTVSALTYVEYSMNVLQKKMKAYTGE